MNLRISKVHSLPLNFSIFNSISLSSTFAKSYLFNKEQRVKALLKQFAVIIPIEDMHALGKLKIV